VVEIPTGVALGAVAAVLAVSVGWSVAFPRKQPAPSE
jgi:hypothetical protein